MASPQADVELIKRKGFSEFVKRAWHQIEPSIELIWGPHMQLVCDHYEALLNNEMKDLVVNVPPGTSKSTIGSILFPAWAWTKQPGLKFMCVAYDEKLSIDFAGRSLGLLTGEWYQDRWPEVKIIKGQNASLGLYKNTKGGLRFSTMMGGAGLGRHANILIIDDPVKTDDLRGGGESAKAALDLAWNERIVKTFSTRKANPKTFRRVLVMQRLHHEDPAGRMVKTPGCIHLRLPMEFEKEHAYVSKWGNDIRTEEGELLCPDRFDREAVDAIKAEMTLRDFAAQHQQRPTPEAGALFMRAHFAQIWSVLPNNLRYLISVDASLKDKIDSDFFVAQVWAWARQEYYLCDQVRHRLAFSDSVLAIKMLYQRWPRVKSCLIEDKANGTAIVNVLRSKIPGVIEVNPLGGKESRANAIEPMLRAGNVFFPSKPFMETFNIPEAISFPVGSHDDTVDAMSQALLEMSGKNKGRFKFGKAMANVRNGAVFR